MLYRFIIIIFFSLHTVFLLAQNGKIIEQTAYTLADTSVRFLESRDSALRPIWQKTQFYHITYLSDGLKVKGYMVMPSAAGKYPCVIFNRGGNQSFSPITDELFCWMAGRLAANGYVVVASQYRGSVGGEGNEEYGGKDVNDVLNMVPLLSTIPQADTSRIGMFGWSRGGMMTYLALTRTTSIKAAVIGSGLTDLVKTLELRPEFDSLWLKMIPGYASNKMAILKERSATYFADRICKTTPLLIIQGTADWRVPPAQVIDLVGKLYELKHPLRFILYEGGQHSLIEHRADYYAQLINWFNQYVRDRKKWPDLTPHGN